MTLQAAQSTDPYRAFLERKQRLWSGCGVTPDRVDLPRPLYQWQAAITRWAIHKGRAAVFADCGLGKSFIQLSWADAIAKRALILAPLCVAEQTVSEGMKLSVPVEYVRDQSEVDRSNCKIVISNYERLEKFSPDAFDAVVLDESSILKAFNGKTRTRLIAVFADTPYRLCCTATPSPNDTAELANHSEFLGLMNRREFLATWFVHDDEGWRMKRHAVTPFYRWLASWAVTLRKPSDLGYADDGFNLPPLNISEVVLRIDRPPEGSLFHGLALKGIKGRLSARRASLRDRVAATAALTKKTGQWILWCGLNSESAALAQQLGDDAIEVRGDDSYSEKLAAVSSFTSGRSRILISKSKILGFGLNFQNCHQMAFVGLGDSFESYYQCIRRCWRFGQHHPVDVAIVVSEAEHQIVENVKRKEASASTMADSLLSNVAEFERKEIVA